MKIGILQTGFTPPSLAARFGQYDGMVGRMLDEGFLTTTLDVTSGGFPHRVEDFDGYVVTGSSAGVYDPLPWIEPLKDFLRSTEGRAKVVGICFGHQIMAEAFGGRVEQSTKGWGLGLHRYELYGTAPWMDALPEVSIAVSHQDQVVERPKSAEVLGGNAFTPNGILSYAGGGAISFQFHPEFEPGFAEALVELRRPFMPGPTDADRALASLRQPDDAARVARWIRRFLRGA